MQFLFLTVLIKRIKALKYFMKDKAVPKRKKALVVLGLLCLPFNFLPTPILFFGIIDDLVLWGFIIYCLKDELDKYWVGQSESDKKTKKDLKGKKIIDVEFHVDEEKKDEHKL